ncbi:hypothetical protein GG681_09050 [Epibacterium sp. SM1969]|uniref:Uncharacterized protein n=1 Tax=Tritonibacter aquimaris TaxID=2663379 RepID=A0A844ATU8_9RHOB|nr:hypothetical protein [Tritonibacter aquimaris]MQY42788.1 hypothetical protein [Tritonibacter aquimaris]
MKRGLAYVALITAALLAEVVFSNHLPALTQLPVVPAPNHIDIDPL